MGFTKNEIALILATAILAVFIGTSALGIATGFVYGDIKITSDQFDEIFDFAKIFAGAAMMYFGFRAGQANGHGKPQS
jgi:hypothetical protein